MVRRTHKFRRSLSGKHFVVSVAVGLILAVFSIWLMNTRLRPAVLAVAENRLSAMISREIITVVETYIQESDANDVLVTVITDSSGDVSALQADMSTLNLLQTAVIGEVISSLGEILDGEEILIPIGNLTGHTLFSGIGPDIPVSVLYEGSANAWYENEFETKGINQTLHRIVLCISTQADLFLPGGVYPHTSVTRITVAETVLVGDVPDSYTYFSQFDSAEDAANAYFDYGA